MNWVKQNCIGIICRIISSYNKILRVYNLFVYNEWNKWTSIATKICCSMCNSGFVLKVHIQREI